MKEHLKTDSLRLGETDSSSIDYLRWPEIIYLMILKNYSYSLYFIYVWIFKFFASLPVLSFYVCIEIRTISERFKRSESYIDLVVLQ